MKIITNNIPRSVIYGYELSDKERKEFDYLDFRTYGDGMEHQFFKYKGDIYDMNEFMRVEGAMFGELKGWHGYQSDSYFSGIVVKYIEDGDDYLIVGRYSC